MLFFFCVTPEWICMHAMCVSLSCLCPVTTHSTRRRQRWMDRWMCNTLEPSSSPPVATVCATMQTASSKKTMLTPPPSPPPFKAGFAKQSSSVGSLAVFFLFQHWLACVPFVWDLPIYVLKDYAVCQKTQKQANSERYQ